MRLVRPLMLFVLLGGFTAAAQSQVAPPGTGAPGTGGVNFFQWDTGSPAPTTGGVDLAVKFAPTTGYTCTEVKFLIVDDASSKTLDQFIQPNPTGMSLSKSFGGYGSNTKLRVYAYAIFQNGTMFDPRDMENDVTTK